MPTVVWQTWMSIGRERTAMGELRTAERIDPKSPEVKGRHGLIAVLEERYEDGIQLLTEALEEGCRYREVYTVLVKTWKELGNSEAVQETRRRFGKKFGDLNPELDVQVLPWVDALSTKDYSLFSHLVQEGSDRDPAIRACQIFDDAVQGEPTSSGKVSLNQTQAVQAWDQLLQSLSPKEQVPTLQAIALYASRADFHAFAGQLWALQGEFQRAIAAWKKAQQLEPNHPISTALLQSLQVQF
ncbi:tetratricopeptide repeat protein [Leptothermofonsia sichuanensis E412]|uniref:tetratricopeptide repeat protein n=1 Tax=Leptothermofonsia sichuanensis TaxID=2917832 RepID=UPI001CA7498D|nr:tetratricopeptide repeat protein [Leptothermofonsia sichuanensis]QZZ20462.1 tetratricopeptide repeat protein [Leptothermofonsia sichuanensis E412]